MRFSIVTPFYIADEDRKKQLLRCIESVKNQEFDHEDFEHVLVNDGSIVSLDIPTYPWIKLVEQENLQRLTAYNTGFKNASGEIITLLDSDDEYLPFFLSRASGFYRNFPSYKMFNFGCFYVHTDGKESIRGPFRPQELDVGHETFGGGSIVNGTFVFHRSVYEELGAFPPHHVENIDCSEIGYGSGPRELWMTSPWDFSAYAQMEFPEIRPYFQEKHPDHPEGLVKEMGNPFGNDYYLFYKYTRKFHSKPIDEYLYKAYWR